ncbi:MAG: BamA/TamA family outer membrane protein [Reinekea sp.]
MKSASRWDISLKPYHLGLQGDLRRTLAEYRKAVNQAAIDVGHDRQVRAETERMLQLLKSRGYYQASIDSSYPEGQDKPSYSISLGPRYRISRIILQGNYEPADEDWRTLREGKPLVATAVLAQQAALKSHVEKHACFYQQSVSHEVQLNDDDATAQVTFMANVSQPATFGKISFTGIGEINESFLSRTTGISSGRCYQRAAIDNAVFSLFDTGLFRQVRPSYQLNDDSQVDVTFSTRKREKRTLSAGIGLISEQGPAVTAGWQHRDLLGMAQTLTLDTAIKKNEQSFGVNLEIPSFFDRRNRLNLENEVVHEDVDVESYQLSSTIVLERTASRHNYFEYGIGYQRINEKVDNQWDVYHQARLPLLYKHDTVSNAFNPNGGMRYSVGLEPVLDIEDAMTPFAKTSLGGQLFVKDDANVTLASRVQWDSIWYGTALGSTRDNIPTSELYSAGGSTSIRGYGYQSIKATQGEDAVGGTNRWLLVNEVRMQFNDAWGVVGFLDVGTISDDGNPFTQQKWYSGIGAGARYYTRFAPIRLDVAFPLDQSVEDQLFHVYFSLGQAF